MSRKVKTKFFKIEGILTFAADDNSFIMISDFQSAD